MIKINVKGTDIAISSYDGEDYINLTDIVKAEADGDQLIKKWLSTKNTIEYLGVWERLKNPDFNLVEFDQVKNEAGSNRFTMSVKRWQEKTKGIGLTAKSGRYSSGTYAHKDIALKFAAWISPELELLIMMEFQRLKKEEAIGIGQIWNIRRLLSKANYRIQTDVIKNSIIPKKMIPKNKEGVTYAEEADLLYLVMFGYTAKEWRDENLEMVSKGYNIRDLANTHQLIVLSNLESLNAELLRNDVSYDDRFKILRKAATEQLKSIMRSTQIEDTYIESPNVSLSKTKQLSNKK